MMMMIFCAKFRKDRPKILKTEKRKTHTKSMIVVQAYLVQFYRKKVN